MSVVAAAPVRVEPGDERERVRETLATLDQELVALAPVKERVREIAALLVIDRLREAAGLDSVRPSLHMCFTGNPGTGKTTVALRMADILHRLGYVERPRLVAVTRDDLVGQYVGHTAPKTKEVLKRAYGGVLFVDEAYFLDRSENERDYGREAIEVLLHAMEAERDRLVVVLAGYKDDMDAFFRANPGMASRIAHHVDFPDYTLPELGELAGLMARDRAYELTPGARTALLEHIAGQRSVPGFANARTVRNLIDLARLRQASRLFDTVPVPSRDDLITLKADDVLPAAAAVA